MRTKKPKIDNLYELMHVAGSFGMSIRRVGNGAICSTEGWRAILHWDDPKKQLNRLWTVHRTGGRHEAYGGVTPEHLAACLHHVGLTVVREGNA